uniref:ATP-dependent helicase BRM n=1 Tax=Anthurium amnicola TaxID=1678845 RepID=A0A1D1ZLS2_9ARAE
MQDLRPVPVGGAGHVFGGGSVVVGNNGVVDRRLRPQPHHHHHHQQQQQQVQQQQLQRQQQVQLQQHSSFRQLRNPEGEEGLLAYQSGGAHGVMVGGSFPTSSSGVPPSQRSRVSIDVPQQHGATQAREESQTKVQDVEKHVQNPDHQAYLQYIQATQQKPLGNLQVQQHNKMGTPVPTGRDQDTRTYHMKMPELMSLQAANQAHALMLRKSAEHFAHVEKQVEQGHTGTEHRSELKPPQSAIGLLTAATMARPVQPPQSQSGMQNIANQQAAMAQLQAMQNWALEHNIDLSIPANANLLAQLLPVFQPRMAALQKPNESNIVVSQSHASSSKQHVTSSPVGSENSAHGNSLSDHSGQGGPSKGRHMHPSMPISSAGNVTVMNSSSIQIQQQLAVPLRDKQNEKIVTHPITVVNGPSAMHPPQASGTMSQAIERPNAKSPFTGPETHQMQYFRQLQQLNRTTTQPPVSSGEGIAAQCSSYGPSVHVPQPRIGFTKQQLHVLKAQILAFRRLKRGERSLPQEVLQAIVPPPLQMPSQPTFLSQGVINQERTTARNVEEKIRHFDTNDKVSELVHSSKGQIPKEDSSGAEEKGVQLQNAAVSTKEHIGMGSLVKMEQNTAPLVKSEQDAERACQKIPVKGDAIIDKGKVIPPQSTASDEENLKKATQASTTPPTKDVNPIRKYHGPLFDFPFFPRKLDPFASSGTLNNTSNLILSYDVKDLLYKEGMEVLIKKRAENLKKICSLLSMNFESKKIRPDLVLRLQIEERKLRLINLQARLRDEVDQQQQEIMAMSDRPYRKFVRQCERQRAELLRQVQVSQKLMREKQLKSIFQWRKKLLEAHWAIRDARTTRNRGVAKYHERMLREFSKKKDDDRNRRMEALKNNDVDRYREMLLEQQSNVPGDAAQRYVVLSSFLSQTEEYLHKLGGKITAAKSHQEVEEAENAAAFAARSQGFSEEVVRAAATRAGEEVMIRNRFSEMNAPRDSSSVNKYYNLAHAVTERVFKQPSMLRAGTLRDYQIVGLQWMLSLYNNKLNGILADEMGLGKTVQVMALIAYLMEFKGNYGPHLIIVPNAVLVNWKSELHNWLPSVSCIFYVGGKDERSKVFTHEVCAMKFNVLVTTYEFIMYDRSKLSKVDWKYIIIDEAQRMKDRESVLSRDLDRYRCQRRLLLTGTPLQNDLKELWSLLNLLLPEVFDNRKAFHDWFSKPFQKDAPSHSQEDDDWLETEKKVIIIHRLHQILEPFMLRRRVEDVEGSLPPKVSIVLKCRMSAMQGAIYDWIKSTGTIRVDPEDELRRVEKNPLYQIKMYKNLNNKCMELRKACNHPLLNYPYFINYSKDFIVRSCGKLWVLDRILIKLQKSGHRVLLFSTMTKLLDILEEYLQWRRLVYRRIDGTTSLEDRESAIVDFNRSKSDCFIFLLSIRAAGRGLNLQTADTVVIYDPDPNPQNEEQAVARAHRIGQKREVKVIYMEAVVDKISSHQKEDELRNGGTVDSEDDLAGKDRYIGSIESLIRNNIQQYKIDMADEVINAGRFDQRTTHEERRMTLETLLHDEERYQETVHDVPSLQEVNRMIARSEEEVELFDQMDEEFDWTGETMKYDQVPKWLRAGSKEVNAVVSNLSRKPSKNIFSGNIGLESNENFVGSSPSKSERRRGRPKGPFGVKSYSIYRELDDEDGEDSEGSSEERNVYIMHEEEGEIGEFDEEEFNGGTGEPLDNKDQSEDERLICDGGSFVYSQALESIRSDHVFEEAGSSGYSSGSQRLPQVATPSGSSQKFGSLSALDAKPASLSKRMLDDLEEGEIAVSSDSHMDLQQSGSFVHDREDGEDEQVLQPKIKRKRSMRIRPRYTVEKPEDKPNSIRLLSQRGSQLTIQADNDGVTHPRPDSEFEAFNAHVLDGHDLSNPSMKQRRNLTSKKVIGTPKSNAVPKSSRLNGVPGVAEDTTENSRESWNSKAINTVGPTLVGTKMSDVMQRKCKNVICKLQRRIEKDGHQIVPILSDLWKRNENLYYANPATMSNNLLDLRRIDQRVDNLEYNGVTDFIADVQLMLKNTVQYLGYSHEVRIEARKFQDVFFGIMKIAFPDTDFREARNAVAFSGSGGPPTSPSRRQSAFNQSKRHKLLNDVESDPTSKIALHITNPSDDELRSRGQVSKFQKETRPSVSSSREQVPLDCPPFPTHPGDLVICKKKRKDREKLAVMQKTCPASPPNVAAPMQVRQSASLLGQGRGGPASPSNLTRVGPVSPPSMGRGVKISLHKDVHAHPSHQAVYPATWPHQRGLQQGSGAGGGPVAAAVEEVQWAKPVKKMRTDTGKRRPSHL